MRPATIAYCVLSLVTGLVYAPFFHIHTEHDSELHAHFHNLDAHAKSDHDDHGSEIETLPEEHHGTSVSVFVAQAPELMAFLVEIQDSDVAQPAMPLVGFVLEQPVRVHDPPGLRFSNPRSPPA